MPLNLSANSGEEFVPYLKYNAKAGRFYIRPQGATMDAEIEKPRLAFDMANIKTGWLYYSEGSGPEKIWDPAPSQMAPKPAGPKKFKRGFEVMVFGADELQGVGRLGLREFSSTASNCIAAILKMYAEYEAGVKENQTKVPFYVCTGVQAIPGAFGTNYEPIFKLAGWVERAKIPAFDEALTSHNQEFTAEQYAAKDDANQAPIHTNGNGGGIIEDEIPFAPEWRI